MSVMYGACGKHGSVVDADKCRMVDSLNDASYRWRYASIDSACAMADSAMALSGGYQDGRMEALCNIGFAMVQRMRYDSAMVCFNQVLKEADNRMYVLMANVGMMRTCKLLALNREYCVYRTEALSVMKTLETVENEMTERQRRLWNVGRSVFHSVEVDYLSFMGRKEEVRVHARFFRDNPEVIAHDSILIAEHYLARLIARVNDETSTVDDKEHLLTNLLYVANVQGLKYFEAIALNGLAQQISIDPELKPKRFNIIRSYLENDSITIQDLPFVLVDRSLNLHEEYGNRFQETFALITLSNLLLQKHENNPAVFTMFHALQMINVHHMTVNPTDSTALYAYEDDNVYKNAENPDYVSTEMRWIADPDIISVPQWMGIVREQLSKLYASNGMEDAAHYYHTMYEKIRTATRQDMMQVQRKESLEADAMHLNIMIAVLIACVVLAVWGVVVFARKHIKKSREKVMRLSFIMDICRNMTKAMPQEIDDEDDFSTAVHEAVDEDIRKLNPTDSESNVLNVFFNWIEHNGRKYLQFAEDTRRIESETYNSERRIEENKRQHVDKSTCISIVQGITPFLDRAIREVRILAEGTDEDASHTEERLEYVAELIDKINEYNEVLGQWVKVRQGMVSLNIENFELTPLLEMLQKGRKTFEAKGIDFEVEQKDAVVKADRALTLFMMNTLLDNARKYTPEGGKVSLLTDVQDEYVEISVKDNGRGLNEEDIDMINNMKVYDSSIIGRKDDKDGMITSNKGFGFGLQNCRGIIEKYKKTNARFGMCAFGVESKLGEGSRFYFRLPRGVKRAFTVLMLMLCLSTNVGAQDALTLDEIYETEKVCDQLEESNNAKKVVLFISFMTLVLAAIIFILLYYKHVMLEAFNLRQLHEFNSRMFKAKEEELPQVLYEGVSDIRMADCVAVAIPSDDGKDLTFYSAGRKEPDDVLRALMHATYEEKRAINKLDDHVQTYPLTVNIDNDNILVGVMGVLLHDSHITKSERIILELIVQFTAIHIYFTSTKIEHQQLQLEMLEDEQRRVALEEQRIHVENMVLDNCLSTIKHETMYYPSRIRQILDAEHIHDINELINYYRDVFALLSQNAGRQLEKSVIKLTEVACDDVKSHVKKTFEKMNKKQQLPLTITVQGNSGLRVRADKILLFYLLDSLISACFEKKDSGELCFSFEMSEGFIKFALSDSRMHLTKEQQAQLFYADNVKMDEHENVLRGSQYLVAKQIIREHDERLGHVGCRIYAEEDRVVFTLPKK